MRTNQITASVLFVFCLSFNAFAGFSPVEYFDFTGWDHNLISNGGQTFENICGDLDVTVTSIGEFDAPTQIGIAGVTITTFHAVPGSNSLRFNFSEPVKLVIASKTVDANEKQSIYTAGTETYMNTSGAAPIVTPNGSGITIMGTAFRITPTGASFGETLTSPVSTLTLGYEALAINKYGQWMVGKLVPEPNSIALLGIGGLGLLMQFRKRK